ncbi:MAG TPA: hypothetical protein VLH09_06455 [Bryobacteraceae bacterium]|nr:hypothetical protein [Bryobacteraceae bacterium]
MCGAGLMLAHQVAGKAVRDSYFLSNYPVSELPKMVIAAAAVSAVVVLLFSRAMGRVGPGRLTPAGFLVSSLAHAVEYWLMGAAPGPWSVAIYFHIVALGAVLLSGFWSQMAEIYDPRTAKQVFGRITGAGTLGGIAGGLGAERVAALFSASEVLLLLAALHLACAAVTASMGGEMARTAGPVPSETVSPRELFRRAPSLATIALVVTAGTASAAILDYLFKAGAGEAFGKGAPLLRFFAVFYTSTQILTFLAQTFLAGRALGRLGIGRTISALPMGVGAGALGALLVPVFPVFTLVRSLETVLRGSLFRAGYELLYTPIPAAEKRAGKSLIDVGCDRAGDALGGGIVQLLLWVGAAQVASMGMGVALGLALIGVWAARRLDSEYTTLVRQRLVDRAVELDLADAQDSTTLTVIRAIQPPPAEEPAGAAPSARTAIRQAPDETLDTLRELRSGEAHRVLAALREIQRPKPVVAAQLLRLLAWDEVSDAVRETLLRDPRHFTGLLIDHLTNEADVQFGIRRRIPRILARCDSPLAVQGLLAGLRDTRFEVRFQCSRALDALLQRRPELRAPESEVFEAAERELKVARSIWDSRRLLDSRESSDPYAFFDEHLRERADQSLEHIFSLLAAVLPRDPVRIAFRALHTDDPALRGLAVEYLEGALPAAAWEGLRPVIEPGRTSGRRRPQEEVLADLLESHQSLLLYLNKETPQP